MPYRPLVTTFQYHSSLAMARHVVTIDALSDGRLDLGVGIGGAPVDRAVGGVPDTSFGALAERLDRGLTETLMLLDGYRLPVPTAPVLMERPGPDDISLSTPYPQFGRLPIVVGGHSPRSLDVAAKHAHRWNTLGAKPGAGDVFEALHRTSEQLSERCLAIDRDPGEVIRSVLLDFNPQISPSNTRELTEMVGRLYQAGFEECIAYAWIEGKLARNTEELLSFVVNDLPALRQRLG